jgi:G3E family GTPase
VDSVKADILIGEPVGSCTDISATVLQPIKALLGTRYNLSPFTVLMDPFRLQAVLDPRMNRSLHPSALYIIRKQLEEADLIALNKVDMLDAKDLSDLRARAKELFPGTPQIALSALNGHGVDEWLGLVHQKQIQSAGHHIPDVDYDVYAEGEAILGWLNATVLLSSPVPADWRAFFTGLLQGLKSELDARSAEIAHVKALLSADGVQLAASLTQSRDPVVVRGDAGRPRREVKLILNARVEMTPPDLAAAVEAGLRAAAAGNIRWQITDFQCLSPSRPQPTHRYSEVI